MRIQHNITALNAHRNLTNNNSSVTKNLEKLSSGYRINRAGDDAAGLAISEKMRAQITGLETAQKNAEDGVSLVQTAEGALTEVHSMLNRMVELATQSANGTYSESNRTEMQKEIKALTEEIDRISDTANFNGTKLFSQSSKLLKATGKVAGVDIVGTERTATTNSKTSYTWTDGDLKTGDSFNITVVGEDGVKQNVKIDLADFNAVNATKVAELINADDTLKAYGIKASAKGGSLEFTSEDPGSGAAYVSEFAYTKGGGNAAGTGALSGKKVTRGYDVGTTYDMRNLAAGDSITVGGKTYTYDAVGDGTGGKFANLDTLQKALKADGYELVDYAGDGSAVGFRAMPTNVTTISLHVGESSDSSNVIDVNIKKMSSKTLDINAVNITSAASAKAAIDVINAAVDSVSSLRSDLGALQNRLEHTINNLGVQNENITAAESRIRDVDMAKEMMGYTKNNILVQASQAMLAQANQVPQGVLQLLQ